MQPFLRYTCASMTWSPVIRRRESRSCSSSRGTSSQRYHFAARLALTATLLDGSPDNATARPIRRQNRIALAAPAEQVETMDTSTVNARVETIAWTDVSAQLDAYGWGMIEQILTSDESRAIAGLYEDDRRFRSHVVMARHGFGRGEYKYFRYPLPDLIADLRAALYARLAPLANRWNEAMG